MEKAFTQRREQIVSDCVQLKTDVDVYNDLNDDGRSNMLLRHPERSEVKALSFSCSTIDFLPCPAANRRMLNDILLGFELASHIFILAVAVTR